MWLCTHTDASERMQEEDTVARNEALELSRTVQSLQEQTAELRQELATARADASKVQYRCIRCTTAVNSQHVPATCC